MQAVSAVLPSLGLAAPMRTRSRSAGVLASGMRATPALFGSPRRQLCTQQKSFFSGYISQAGPSLGRRHSRQRQFSLQASGQKDVEDMRRSRILVCSSLAAAISVPLRMLISGWLQERKLSQGTVGSALHIPTANALRSDFADRSAATRDSLEDVLGISVESLDLDHYARHAVLDAGRGIPRPDKAAKAELEDRVSGASMLIVGGGNTFYLQAAVHCSGFGEIAGRHSGERGLPYMGMSAGGIIAGETVATAFWKGWDDPAAAPGFDFVGNKGLAQGMNLLDGRAIFPHYDSTIHAGLVAERRGGLDNPQKLVTLADDEAFVWTRDGSSHQSDVLRGE
ncbi:unnamed protein product [Polarella glacialis]|uniref:Cyanophycinase n=1 Tax=Polarella glacialis TaxID=89957 RepID=A0A813HE55_POLGL|nr:unnamed protein product [Polarella glacialis]CAE8636351.1 unnamed protein product [Polarella glacialis]CAE8648062.1 unnamed protein product [Polarella glacialis]